MNAQKPDIDHLLSYSFTLLTHQNIFSENISKGNKSGFQIGEVMKTNVSLKCVSLISGCLKPERIHNVGLEKLF